MTLIASDSLGDLVNQFDEEMTKVRESPPVDDCHVMDIESQESSTEGDRSRNASIDGGTLTRDLTLTRQVDDDTLTRQTSTGYYCGSSLIRGSPDGEEVVMRPETTSKPKQKRVSKLQAPGKTPKSPVENKKSRKKAQSSTDEDELPVVMKPKRSSVTPRVSQTNLNRKKSDTTDDDTEKPKRGTRSRKTEPKTSTLQKTSTNILQKSGSNKSIQKSPSGKLIQNSPSNKSIQKSSSNKSIEIKASRDKSGTTGTMGRPRPGTSTKTPAAAKPSTPSARTFNKPTASSTAKTSGKATLPRKGSISQDENPFNSNTAKRAGISKSAPTAKTRPKSVAIPQSSAALPDKQRTIRSEPF